MANWNGLQLTNKGIALQAKVQAGTQLHITKLKLGSGVVPSGTDIKTLTDLIAPEQNLGIGGKEAVDDYCKISSTISNTGLDAGYYVRELGVFAQDPDDGEILYMYTTDGAPDYLPAGGGSTVISQEFSVMIAVDDTDNIVVDIDPAALATMGYVQLQIQEHNTDTTAHADFTGATAEAAGKRGMVPAPAAGDQNKALFGDKSYKSVVQSINGITPTSGDVDINRKFYNSLAQLGLNYDTVTFDQIANTLPVNSTLTFYVDIVTSQPTYAPNLDIPVSGFIVVTKGNNNSVPIKFTLSPIANNSTTYLGEYTTYNSYGFKGWQPIVLSVNGAKPNNTGNVTMAVDAYTEWKWTDGSAVIDGFTVKFPNGYKQCVWYLYFPSTYTAMTINFPKAFNSPPCVFGSIVVVNDSKHLTANVYDVTTTSCRCVTNNNGNTATYWVAMGYDS